MKAQNKAQIAVISACTFLFAFGLATAKAYAKEVCYTQYGGGETCITVNDNSKLEVDKQIYNPDSGEYENHIQPKNGSYPYRYGAREEMTFRIRVKNTGDIKIKDIHLEDILPSFISYHDGDGDGKDDNTRVTFDTFDLNPGDSRTFNFTAKIAKSSILPKDDRICLTNIAKAKGVREDNGDKEDDVDYANFCIELPKVRGKEKITSLPVTGNPEEMLLVIGLSATGLVVLGYGLKKLAKSI